MKVKDLLDLFADFYEDFDRAKAESMCETLHIDTGLRMKSLSKGTKEKVQLILVMSRQAKRYLLDEPIAGVERVLDEVVFIKDGKVLRQQQVDDIREQEGKSVDELFRELFRMEAIAGGEWK